MIFLIPKPSGDSIPAPAQQPELPPLVSGAIQFWLARLISTALAEYAEKKAPRDRSLQNGQAWTTFLQTFGPGTGPGILYACVGLHRFARADNPLSPVLFGAGFALFLEQDCLAKEDGLVESKLGEDARAGAIAVPDPDLSADPAKAILWARQTIERWCDWLDAAIHLRTHSFWHHSPVAFDPDPEKRDLACLGLVQRCFAHQPIAVQDLWRQFHSDAAEHFKNSPKWLKVGQAMTSTEQRPWPYREVDTAIISLWPLLKRHNWTYRDLMNLTRSLISRPDAYPCQREQDFVVHCRTVLGLRKSGRGKSCRHGHPPGHQIAPELFMAALNGLSSVPRQPLIR